MDLTPFLIFCFFPRLCNWLFLLTECADENLLAAAASMAPVTAGAPAASGLAASLTAALGTTLSPSVNQGADSSSEASSGISITNKTAENNSTSLVLTIGENFITQWWVFIANCLSRYYTTAKVVSLHCLATAYGYSYMVRKEDYTTVLVLNWRNQQIGSVD